MNLTKATLLACMLLTACSSYNNQFDCPIGQGLKCASLSEVNQKIDDGTLPFESNSNTTCPGCSKVHWREALTSPSSQGQ